MDIDRYIIKKIKHEKEFFFFLMKDVNLCFFLIYIYPKRKKKKKRHFNFLNKKIVPILKN